MSTSSYKSGSDAPWQTLSHPPLRPFDASLATVLGEAVQRATAQDKPRRPSSRRSRTLPTGTGKKRPTAGQWSPHIGELTPTLKLAAP